MTRTIYLAVFSNGERPAHWSIYIPTSDTGNKGKVIHVTGTTATGFFLELKRNYDFDSESRHYIIIPLAKISDRKVIDTPGDGSAAQDTTARDILESTATVVPPPGPSANPFDSSALDCQHWIGKYIEKLIANGFIAEDAISVLKDAPRTVSRACQ